MKQRNISKRVWKLKRNFTRVIENRSVRLFIRQTHAASPVVANLILIAAVIVLGFTALAYARNLSADYQRDYQQSIASDISKLKENIAFEYVYYDSAGRVHAYFINSGSIEVEVASVHLGTFSNPFTFQVKYMDGTVTPNHIVGIASERQIYISNAPASLPSGSYSFKITTVRGSSFEYSFSV